MFKLQRLEISGFKSFADYTEIVFTGEGITAVVGPNGCGKSNISDAISWVLGEQSAKNLRGGEMQDVIFQGTKSRSPSGMAEVVLHLTRDEVLLDTGGETDDFDRALQEFDAQSGEFEDYSEYSNQNHEAANGNGSHTGGNGHGLTDANTNGAPEVESAGIGTATAAAKYQTKRRWKPRQVALDFAPGEAVSITRRLYRSGESDYSLNNRACRLRDIQDLFAGTGLAGASYALIQQERIGQILSAKPSDRRGLIEEAAGTTKFRTRGRAAELRLEAAKTNLRRLSDIVSEVERQANSLRRQAAKTRRFRELQESFRELLRRVFGAEGTQLAQILDELCEKLAAAARDEQNLANAVGVKTEAAKNATAAARQAEDDLTVLRENAAQNAVRRERLASNRSHQTEQVRSLEERAARLRHEIKISEERQKQISADVERLREKNKQSNLNGDSETDALGAADAEFQKYQTETRRLEAEIETIRRELLQHTAAAERLREIARQQTNTLERLTERAAGLEREGIRAAETLAEKRTETAALEIQIVEQKKIAADLQTRKQIALETVNAARENLREAEKTLNQIRDEASGVKHRRETLEQIDANKAMLAPTVQKLFAAREELGINLRGTLADFLRVEARFEKAVEAVFGAFLQTVLVDSNADALKILEKSNDFGQLKILSLEPVPVSRKSDDKNNFAALLGISDELKSILDEVLPVQMNFRIIENLDEAANFSNENCATLGGELIFKNRLFGFGNAQTNGKSNGILSFKRELRELAARADELKIKLEKAAAEVEKRREILAQRERNLSDSAIEITRTERELMSAEVNFKSLVQDRERAERHQKVVADESQRLEQEREEAESKRQKAESEAAVAEKARLAAAAELNAHSSNLAQVRKKAETANAVLSEKRAALAAATERRRSLSGALRRVEAEQNELAARTESGRKELAESISKAENLRAALDRIEREADSFENERIGETERIAAAGESLAAARNAADKFAAELGELNLQAAAAKDRRASIEIEQAETIVKLQNLGENCVHELHRTIAELMENETPGDFDLADGKKQAENLREKLDNFGAVNLLALEELSESEERLSFLTAQRKDIVDSIAMAEEALGEIKRRSRELFERAFAEINRNFTEIFTELFGGGRGEMNLLDTADVLESGIEIVAQPPGKRLQNLLLLSGGEKAMTAIALVLAIFRFRPAPFCLLDEVDAPLDEANVGRFVEKIGQMSEKTQFLVVTHNKRTMEAARALYGVTMAEAGISKVVSVKFE